MDIIEKEFYDIAIKRNKLFLYNKENALAVIERCKQLNIWILGIDAFIITGKYIQPYLEYSSDYSSLNRKHDIWSIASDFIKNMIKENDQLIFEVGYDLDNK